jgi:hypothetical protein
VLLVVQHVQPLPAAAGLVVPRMQAGRAAQHQPERVRAHCGVGARPLQRQLARRHGHRLPRTRHDRIRWVEKHFLTSKYVTFQCFFIMISRQVLYFLHNIYYLCTIDCFFSVTHCLKNTS